LAFDVYCDIIIFSYKLYWQKGNIMGKIGIFKGDDLREILNRANKWIDGKKVLSAVTVPVVIPNLPPSVEYTMTVVVE